MALENANSLDLSTDYEDETTVSKRRGAPNIFTAEVADWLDPNWLPLGMDASHTSGYFDIIVCNPPYIAPSHHMALDPGVKDWEDIKALVRKIVPGI